MHISTKCIQCENNLVHHHNTVIKEIKSRHINQYKIPNFSPPFMQNIISYFWHEMWPRYFLTVFLRSTQGQNHNIIYFLKHIYVFVSHLTPIYCIFLKKLYFGYMCCVSFVILKTNLAFWIELNGLTKTIKARSELNDDIMKNVTSVILFKNGKNW